MPHSPGIGAIFGIVSEGGVAKVGGRVGLYDRSTMQLVAKTTADSYGGYVFNGLNQTTSDYLVMAVDDDGSPAKNALVQDYVQPILAHMGATFPGNWWRLVMLKDPAAVFLPYFAGGFPGQVTPSFDVSDFCSVTGSLLTDQNSLMPGAPYIPSVKMNPAWMEVPARSRTGSNAPGSPTSTYSVEWICDTSQSGLILGIRSTTGDYGGAYWAMPLIILQWNRSTHTLKGAIGKEIVGINYDAANTSVWNTAASYTDNNLSDAAHHIVLTVTMGVEAKLYIDNALVNTTSLVGTNAAVGNPINAVRLSAITGSGTPGSTTITTGPFVIYPSALTQGEITALYNAAMVGSEPLVTGYVRDVVVDLPAVYYRQNATQVNTEVEYMAGGAAVANYGPTTFAVASAVTGGAMTKYNNAALRQLGGGGPLSKTQATFEFWMNPDSATPAATGSIACGRWSDESTVNWQIKHIITSGKITIDVRKSTAAIETINFNYAPPASTNTLIAIVLDKVAGTAKIYANGVLQDTQSLLVGYFEGAGWDSYVVNGTNWNKKYFFLGGLATAGGIISSPYYGSIGEFAIYTRALGVDRLLSHYDSRTVT